MNLENLLDETVRFRQEITVTGFFILIVISAFIINKKFLIPSFLKKFYPGIILKRKKNRLKIVSYSKEFEYLFKDKIYFSEISENLDDQKIITGDVDKGFCLLKNASQYCLTNYSIIRFPFFGVRYLITFADSGALYDSLADSINKSIITDQTGLIVAGCSEHEKGFFLPSLMAGDHPEKGKWNFQDTIDNKSACRYYVSQDLKSYWSGRLTQICRVPFVIWNQHSLPKLKAEINKLDFPVTVDFYNYRIENTFKQKFTSHIFDDPMLTPVKMDQAMIDIPLPVTCGFITYEDRLQVQARQMETLLDKIMEQKHPDPDSFLEHHLYNTVIQTLHPLYAKIEKRDKIVKQTENLSDNTVVKDRSIHDYKFSDIIGESRLFFQLNYPLSSMIQKFLTVCFEKILPLMSAENIDTERLEGIREDYQSKIRSLEEKIEDSIYYHTRIAGIIDKINLTCMAYPDQKGLPPDFTELITDAAFIKNFDVIFNDAVGQFQETIDLNKLIINVMETNYQHFRKLNITFAPPAKHIVFQIKTDAGLMEKAIRIILLQIFPFGKSVDILSIKISDQTIEITGIHSITKPFDDMELELKFIKKVMDKSGLVFSINAKEIIIDRLS